MSVRAFRTRKWPAFLLSLLVLGSAVWAPASVYSQAIPGGSQFAPSSGGASYPVSDEVFKVCDDGDTTKCVELENTGITTANTIAVTFTGTSAAPNMHLGVDPMGLNTVLFVNDGQNRVSMASSTSFGWTSGGANNALTTALLQETTAILQMGVDVNGAAVNQTFKAHDGITGTDISGAGLTLASGRGTGTGTAFVQIQTSPSLATGTTAQTLETRDYIFSGSKTLADNSATAFVDIGVVTDDAGAVQVFYEVKAENATDQQVISGIATVAFYNDAGTEACGAIVESGEASAASTGTITATITCTVSLTDEVRLNMTSDTSLNVSPTLKWRIIGGTIGAVQPQ